MKSDLTKVAVAVIRNNDGEALIVQNIHKKTGEEKTHLIWQFPGGKIKDNETPQDAATRETLDQTGYEITPKEIIGEKDHPEYEVYIYYVAAYLEGQQPQERVEKTAGMAKWINPQELEQYFSSNLEPKLKEYFQII